MTLQLPPGITSTPIREYGNGYKVRTAYTVYTFMTIEAAERFAAVASKPGPKRTPASAVHLPARRLGPLPVCLIRATVKQGLKVDRTPPPDGHRPTPALRIIRAAESEAAEEIAA